MNKKILFLFFCFILFCCSATKAQIISVTPGTDFNVATGTIISLENLQLTPSANFTFSGIAFNKTTIATNSNSIPALSTYYKFSATSTAFSGEVLFTYLDAELNGLTESGLKLLYHNGSAWVFDNSGTNYPGTNYVTTTLTSKTLNELSLGTGTLQTYYVDDDGDGFGSTVSVQLYDPTPPAGYSVNNTDCDDADIAVNASTITTTVVIACGTYTWDVNGQAYLTGGTFSVDVNSCHTEVLELTINTIPAKPIIACWQTLTLDTTACAWVVTGTAPATPSVTISADNSTICAGSPVTFTAAATDGGTNPTYQWVVNGNSVQNGLSANYTTSNLTSTDVVTVTLTTSNEFVLSNGFATIGSQKWSASNLNVTTYSNGETIPQITTASEWANTTEGAWCYFNNDSSKDKLYNGYAVTDARGLAPSGFHIPTQGEWEQLVTTLGGATAASLALRATSGWPNNGNGTNSSHFTALPGGLLFLSGDFWQEENGFWWNATEAPDGSLGYSQMNAGQAYIEYDHFNVKNLGMNVRFVSDTASCVSNETVASNGITITVTTPATPGVTISVDNSTICAGSPVTFTAAATNGGANPTYQWEVNGNSVQNSLSANYTTSNLTSTDVVTVVLTPSNGTTTIGTQAWSATNLNATTYSNGDPIPQITNNSEWANTTEGAWCYFNNDPANGKLYNGYAVTDARGLAPAGFHIATQGEWNDLVTTLGGSTAASLALRATSGWFNNGNGTNSSGFSALPGGLMLLSGGFDQDINGFWWNATEDPQGNLGYSQMNADLSVIDTDLFIDKNYGFNVRCISDTASCVSNETVASNGISINVTSQPDAPTGLACYETAEFDITTCTWIVSGMQDPAPTGLACYETAEFDITACAWVVTGSPLDQTVYYQDLDSDGFGNTAVSFFGCAQEGYVSNNLDSNDSLLTYVDGDGDGFGSTVFAPSGVTNNFDSNDSLLTYLDLDDDGYGSTTLVSNGVTNNLDCNDSLSTTHPGAIEICYDGIDNDCDGTVDEGCVPLVSEVQTAQCGQTLAKIDDYVYANLVAGAQGYRFKVTNTTTGQVQTIDRYLRVFRITQLLNYAFNTEYQVEVAVLKYNVWQPSYGASCTIKTPAPTTQLTSPVNNLSALTDVLYANLVPFATGYQFKITNASNAADTQTINRNLREFRMSLLAGITYNNATYNVQVAVRNTDGITYLPYGPVCTVITPAFPSTFLQSSQCSDYEVPNYTSPLYAEPFTGAQGYRFKLENSGLGYSQEVDRYLRTVRLSDFTGLTPGSTYTVKVALKINGVWGSYTGKSCSVIVPGGITRTEEVAEITKGNFAAVAYPNPFANTFAIQIQTTSTAVIQMKVYDLLGRLVEQRETNVDAKDNVAFGERYPSGVYSVVVTQGGITETLRVVKR